MKTLLLLAFLLSFKAFSYPIPDQDYWNLGDNQKLCVRLIKEHNDSMLTYLISTYFNYDISSIIFNTQCKDPDSSNKYDLLRASLMNPIFLNFEEDPEGYDHGVTLFMFTHIFHAIENYKIQKCSVLVKDKDGKDLIKFTEDLKIKVKQDIQAEIMANGYSHKSHRMKQVLAHYDDAIETMKGLFKFSTIQNPATECPSWN